MKKLFLLLSLVCSITSTTIFAQTLAPAQVNTAPVPLTPEQITQELAGFIYSCATVKPLLGWKTITVSLDRNGSGMNVYAYATMGNNSIKKLELCDRQQTAQALIDMLNITTKGKTIEWQSLLFRSQPNRQFEFNPLTAADVAKINQTAKP